MSHYFGKMIADREQCVAAIVKHSGSPVGYAMPMDRFLFHDESDTKFDQAVNTIIVDRCHARAVALKMDTNSPEAELFMDNIYRDEAESVYDHYKQNQKELISLWNQNHETVRIISFHKSVISALRATEKVMQA